MPKDAIDTKCWLNNVWNKPFTSFLHCLLNTLHVVCFNGQSTPVRECDFNRKSDSCVKGFNDGLDLPSVASEGRTRFSTIDGPTVNFENLWLIEFSPSTECFSCSLFVSLKIVTSSMRNTDTFDPTIRTFNLNIPAIRRIMRHFIGSVLSETQSICIDTDSNKEIKRATHKESDRWVSNQRLLNSIAKRHLMRASFSIDQIKLNGRPRREIMIYRLIWIDKILQLCHVKFSKSNHALTR